MAVGGEASDFAHAILETIDLPLVALDADLRVTVVNEAFLRLFEVTSQNTLGRRLYDLGHGQWNIAELRELLEEVLTREVLVKDYRVEHTFPGIGRRVMQLNAKRMTKAGQEHSILLAISDETERERHQFEIDGRIEFADKLIDSVREAVLILHGDLRVHSANQVFYDLFRVPQGDTTGRLVYELGNGQWDIPELRLLLEEILPLQKSFDDYEVHHTFDNIGHRIMLLNARRLDHLDFIVLAVRDVTDLRGAERERQKREAALREQFTEIEALYRNAPVGLALFDREFRFVRLNATLADINGVPIEQHIGRLAWDIVPALRATVEPKFRQVLETGDIVQSEIIGETAKAPGIQRYWNERFYPLKDSDGRVLAIGAVVDEITEQREAEERLRASRERLRRMFETDAIGIVVFDKMSGRLVEVNDQFLSISGYSAADVASGRLTWMTMTPEENRAESERQLAQLAITGRIGPYEREYLLEDGRRSWILLAARDLGDGTAVAFAMDIADRKRAEAQLRFLMGEVNHRSKNILSLVQAIARQTVASDPASFAERFSARLKALAASQDLLVKNEWRGVDLGQLVRAQLAHFADLIGTRIFIEGPTVNICSAASQTLGMAIYELATNAGKYGALSNRTGKVRLTWQLAPQDGADRFFMFWHECGGPSVKTPERRGFGSKVIDGIVRMSLDADVQLDYPEAGAVWKLSCPAGRIIASDQPASGEPSAPKREPAKAGRRKVLVVEDDALCAMDLSECLEAAGWHVIGPAASVRQAMALLESSGCDLAVLDINLDSETSEPVATALFNRSTPFLVVSGYSSEQAPNIYRSAPLLTKPINHDSLTAALMKLGVASFRNQIEKPR
jgi:PAS domain S-box-containing protein